MPMECVLSKLNLRQRNNHYITNDMLRSDKIKRTFAFTVLPALCLLLLSSTKSWSQALIENKYYSVQPATGFQAAPAFIITHKTGNLKRTILPKLQLVYTTSQPEMIGASMDGQPG